MPANPTFPPFQPVELSDPAYEHDHVRHLTFFSPALRGRGDVSLYLPPQAASVSALPIVILLHGVYGSHWNWFYNGGAHRTAHWLMQEGHIRPMLVATPSDGLTGDGSAYLPWPERNAEAWICEDVIGCLREVFPATSVAPVFLCGLSMGGYGALRMGAKHPEKFHAISAHSAVTSLRWLDQFVRDPVHADKLMSREADILYWMERNRDRLPPLRLDCGTEDHLFEANEVLQRELAELGIPHTFDANVGGHEWPYWQTHVTDSLKFFEGVLREKESRSVSRA
jgi:enterochelin esterase-like enzyme